MSKLNEASITLPLSRAIEEIDSMAQKLMLRDNNKDRATWMGLMAAKERIVQAHWKVRDALHEVPQ
jgi:hypothetical protein